MKKSIFILMLLSFVTFSCNDIDFGDINVDPNDPSSAPTATLLRRAQLAMSFTYSDTRPSMYVQYLSNGQYNDESNYVTQRFPYTENYQAITNLDLVIADETSSANEIAVARLVKSYLFHIMTDRWGMLPYTTAGQGLDSKFNVFDSQEAIYNSLFSEVEGALAQMDAGSGPAGDIVLNGNMSMWKIFGNTLMMNMAMRLSKKSPTTAQTYFNKAIAGGVISSNAQNIMYTYIADDNHDNPWQDRFETRTDYLLSRAFVTALIGSGTGFNPEDPRLAKYGQPAKSSGSFTGAPYGNSNSLTDNYSFITDNIISNQEAPGYLYTYAQVSLHMAEAAQLGWISSGTAQSYINQGIRASMEQWGVASADIDEYIANRTSLGGQKEIAYQKWVALFLQGYESWSEWRKQGADQVQLTKPADAVTAGIPQRHAYPLSSISTNGANYNAAVAEQGEDNTDTKVWWAK